MKKFQFHTIFVFQTFWLLNAVGVFGLQFEDWSQQFSGKRFRPIVLVPRDSEPTNGPGSRSKGGPPPAKKEDLLYKSNFIPNEILFQKSKYKPPNRPAFWRYYDIKWALNFMHSRRHLVPDINFIEFFKSVEKSIFDDIMTNHIGVSMKRFKKLEHARSLSSKLLPKFPQISSEKQDENTKLLLASTASEAIVDLYPLNGGYSVMGVDADSAVGLLGLLLFINLLRDVIQTVSDSSRRRRKKRRKRQMKFSIPNSNPFLKVNKY